MAVFKVPNPGNLHYGGREYHSVLWRLPPFLRTVHHEGEGGPVSSPSLLLAKWDQEPSSGWEGPGMWRQA